MSEQTLSIIDQIEQLASLCNTALKKELTSLVAIMREVGAATVAELKKPIADAVKAQRTSTAGFTKRVQARLDNQPTAEAIETLVSDFKTLNATTVKGIAKKFELNITSKSDADSFEKWLRTGIKPPTQEELIANEIDELALKAIDMRDQSRSELKNETINEIMDIAEGIKKKHKVPGLRLFLAAFGLTPTGTTAQSMIKDIKGFLDALAIDRIKRQIIQTM